MDTRYLGETILFSFTTGALSYNYTTQYDNELNGIDIVTKSYAATTCWEQQLDRS